MRAWDACWLMGRSPRGGCLPGKWMRMFLQGEGCDGAHVSAVSWFPHRPTFLAVSEGKLGIWTITVDPRV
jgi:hypothetical protein